jgi:propionate CoA-transferase
VKDGKLAIASEGKARKFVPEVEHRTFSGGYAWKRRQPVLYITERCVFRLCEDGLELIEVAPGIDLERDILAHMGFRPVMRAAPRLMDPAIFSDQPMQLRERMLSVPLEKRLTYAADQNIFFINFERMAIRTKQDIEDVRAAIDMRLSPLGRKIYAIVNYDNFAIPPELIEPWTEMVKALVDKYYWGVTRYTTSNFLRMKLGDSLAQRGVAPHIYESAEEAHHHLQALAPAASAGEAPDEAL